MQMSSQKLLIAGIDPGTTLGYAVLDIEGNFIKAGSSKQLDLNSLISEIISLGKAILVGTDKAKVPGFVESFTAKLGARIASPKEDLKVEEKRKMYHGFSIGDEHQGDALASALFAYRETRELLSKIDNFARENKKQGIKDRIKELVITKRLSIRNAVEVIEGKEEEDRIIEKAVSKKRADEMDFLKLYNKLKMHEAEIKLVKKYNSKLKSMLDDLRSREVAVQKDEKKVADFRESRIKFLGNLLNSKNNEIMRLKSLAAKSKSIILNINNFYILKKLDTLGINEFNFKNKILNIQRNDILLVDEPNIASDEAVRLLKNRVFIIVHRKEISKKNEGRLPFIFISAKNLKIYEERHFGIVEKSSFETERSKIDWVSKIVNDYKKEKEQLVG